MNLDHIKYMLNSEPVHTEIMLDSEGLKPKSMIGLDMEILLELFEDKPMNMDWARYRGNLNL